MKKVAVLLTLLFGASLSMVTYADATQPSPDNSQQQTQQQLGADKQVQGNSDNSANSAASSSTNSKNDEDTAS